MIYWDYNATAPLRPLVKAKVIECLDKFPGNASSPHALGQSAKAYIETVRRQLCEKIGLKPTELIFCGSATEANVLALWGHWFYEKKKAAEEGRKPGKLLVGPLEHSSIDKNVECLKENEGIQSLGLPLKANGLVDLEKTEKLLAENRTWLVSMHAACNETGIIQPWQKLAQLCHSYQVPFHSDLVQIFGRAHLNLSETHLGSGTLAFHKSGGLKGIGALILRHPNWKSMIMGGAQEKKRRAGTENILGVASVEGLVAEIDQIIESYQNPIRKVRDSFEQKLKAKIPQVKIVGSDVERLPNTSFCVFPGVAADVMLMSLDVADICASAGSACSSGLAEASTKLTQLGFSTAEAGSAVRFSFGESCSFEQIDQVISVIDKTIQRVAA